MLYHWQRSCAFCGLLLVLFTAWLWPGAAPHAQAAPTAPTDTPIAVISDTPFGEWIVADGLFYWAQRCIGGEFRNTGFLRRQPINSGALRTLATVDREHCYTFLSMGADASGLYYFNNELQQIEFRPSGSPFDPPQAVLATNAIENRMIKPYGDFIYWFTAGTILRAHRDGTGVETVANTATNPTGLTIITFANNPVVYWADDAGIWQTSLACGTLPCDKTALVPLTNGGITDLLYYSANLFSSDLYWVENPIGGAARIRRQSCSGFAGCAISTVYTAPTDWTIGHLAFTGTQLFWPERLFTNLTADGKIRRWTVSTNELAEIAGGYQSLSDRIAVDSANVYFHNNEPNRSVIYKLPLSAATITRDLAADAWEVTQGIQNTANQAPLAANKTTYVRVYGRQLSGPNTLSVEARLYGTRNGAPLPGSPLSPINGLRSLVTGGSYNRVDLNSGWYFQLPYSWTNTGGVHLEATLDPRQFHNDSNRTNNTLLADLTFQNQPPACVVTMPVRTHTALPTLQDPNVWNMIDRFKRLWPVPDVWVFLQAEPVEELQACWWGFIPYPCYGPYELEEGWSFGNGMPDKDKAIASIGARAVFSDDPDICDNRGASVHYMGMVHPEANTGNTTGYANLIINASWVKLPPHTTISPNWNAMWESSTMAQELTHNFNRGHVNCGTPDNVDNNYPYPVCQLDAVGPTAYYGFDVATLKPIAPDQASDYMSYGRSKAQASEFPNWQGRWVSDYTWRGVMNEFVARQQAQSATTTTSALSSAANVALATGYIDSDNGRGELDSVNVLPGAALQRSIRRKWEALVAPAWSPTAAKDATAAYHLRLLDANGATLADQQITLEESDDHDPAGHFNLFMLTFPAPTGAVAKVELLADNTVLDTLTFGSGTPTVTVQQPTSGSVVTNRLTMAWQASDPDNDPLLFTVQYSYDNGGHWQALAADIADSPAPTTTLTLDDLSMLHGSTGATALLRVLASDGYNTGIGVSQPFQVSNRAPVPTIIVPTADQIFPADQPVALRGVANDAEDGGLNGESLQWAVQGTPIGSSADQQVNGLAPGAYTVQLQAIDTLSQTATATSTLNLAPVNLPLTTAPTLDGTCSDDSYAAGVALPLAPYGDGTQGTVYLVRSDDALWACFTALTNGPTDSTAFAALRIDVDHSREAQAQATDYTFAVGEDGGVASTAGDGAGNFSGNGPSGLQGQINAGATTWEAELRIPVAAVGGWDHTVGLAVEHGAINNTAYRWPWAATAGQPNTWATTTLGNALPQLTALTPFTATVGDGPITLTVDGFNFASGATLYWSNVAVTTTFVSSTQLTATVSAAQLATAGTLPVTVRNPLTSTAPSNALPFTVWQRVPVLQGLTPDTTTAEGPTFTLTVTGTNFVNGAQVLWNNTPLPTTFVSGTQLQAQVSATLLNLGQVAGITVSNPAPSSTRSAALTFEVQPKQSTPTPANSLYLPLIKR